MHGESAAEDERQVFAEWLPAPPPDPNLVRRVRRLRWEVGLTAAGIVGFWATITAIAVFSSWHVNFFGVSYSAVMASIVAWSRVRNRRAPPALEDLVDLPPIVPQFPVEATFLAIEVPYGRDVGIVSFVDGWLHFQGRRTAFSLHAADASHSAERLVGQNNRKGRVAEHLQHKIEWFAGVHKCRIDIIPMDSMEGLGDNLRAQFVEALYKWKDHVEPRQGTPVWPPVTVQEGWRARNVARFAVVAAGTSVLALFTIAITVVLGRFAWYVGAVVLVAGGFLVHLSIQSVRLMWWRVAVIDVMQGRRATLPTGKKTKAALP